MENEMHLKGQDINIVPFYENDIESKIAGTDGTPGISIIPKVTTEFETGNNDLSNSIESAEVSGSLPVAVVDDLINLYDEYDLYLINEEIVYTEPFMEGNEVTPTVVCSTDGTIIYEEDGQRQYLIVEEVESEKNDMNEQILHLTEECSSSLMIENKSLPQCSLCNSYFSCKSELIDHRKLHGIWTCIECDAELKNGNELTEHIAKFHTACTDSIDKFRVDNTTMIELKPHVCKFCNVRFTREKALISHENIHKIQYDKSHQFICKHCEEQFPKQQLLNEHLTICSVNYLSLSPTKTTAKRKKSSTKRKKQQASQESTDKKSNDSQSAAPMSKTIHYKVACSECDKMFPTKQKMYRHKWIHRKKAFSCETCAMSFLLQIELDKHRLCEHAEQKKNMCNICGRHYTSRQGLWEHNRLHDTNNVVPYNCSQCNKDFTSRQGYLIHLRIHSGQRPFSCTYCDKAFRDGGTLRKHTRIHTGERPHKCPLCEKSFNQKVVMREHIRWVHASNKVEYPDPAPYTCALCLSTTTLMDREELCTHIVKHSDQIAAKMKESTTKATESEENDTESDSSDSHSTDQQPMNGAKCDRKIIRKNRKILSKLLNKQKTISTSSQAKLINRTDKREKLSTIKCNTNVANRNFDNLQTKCDVCKSNCNVKELFCDHVEMHIIG